MPTTTELLEKLAELDRARSEAEDKVHGHKAKLQAQIDRVREQHDAETKADRDHLSAIQKEIRDTTNAYNREAGISTPTRQARSSGTRAPRGSVPNVPDSAADDVVSFLKGNGPAKSKAIRQGIGVDEAIPAAKWSTFLSSLADSGSVKREGQKAGTTYSV